MMQLHYFDALNKVILLYRRDGVVVGASASQTVNLAFISQLESYQNTLKNDINSFSARSSAQKGYCGEQVSKLARCVLEQET